jgi:UDP-N-acetylglucosamine transferase subunit ALG13
LVAEGKIKEPVVAQTGYSTYTPEHTEHFKFVEMSRMEKLIDRASIVITHAGIGTLMLSLKKNKKIIAVPRLKKFGEHTNDHQVQIVKELESQNRLLAVYDIENLEAAIQKIKNHSFNTSRKENKIVAAVEEILSKWERVL